jgi:hypothetical protein
VAVLRTQAEQRGDLVAMLNGVTAPVGAGTATLAAHEVKPPSPVAYDCWPVWQATRPTGMCIYEIDWTVFVALPGADAQTWVANGDPLVAAVMAALDTVDVQRVEPVQIPVTEGQAMPALQLTLTI